MTTTQTSWIGNLFASIVAIFHKAETIGDQILKTADGFVNAAKVLESSQVGQFIETEIEDLFPQFKGAIDAVKTWFPAAAGRIANVQSTVTTDEAKVQAFLDYANGLKTSAPTEYAGVLTTLNASLQQLLAGVSNVTSLTPQMSLAAAPVAHDATLGTAVE